MTMIETPTVFVCVRGRGRNSGPSYTLSTSGGTRVARDSSLAWIAAQARSLLSRKYPAFVRRGDVSVEIVRVDDSWRALPDREDPGWVRALIEVLNESQGENKP